MSKNKNRQNQSVGAAPTGELSTDAVDQTDGTLSIDETDTANTGDAGDTPDAAGDDAGDLDTATGDGIASGATTGTVEEPAVVGSVMEPSVTTQAPVQKSAEAEAPAPAPGSVATLQANEADAAQLGMYRMRMDEHVANMGRAVPVTPKDGAAHQLRLYRLIVEILRQEGTVFTRAWSDLLAKVHAEAHGAFHLDRAFRFFDQLKLDATDSRVFQNLLHLIVHTADPKGRALMLKSIDIGSVTANVPVPGAADKLTSFYAP